MRKHNEEMGKGKIEAEQKQRQAQTFRQTGHSIGFRKGQTQK
jgi:hypothetical protein